MEHAPDGSTLDLPLMRRVLGIDDEDLRELVWSARMAKWSLPQLVLSAAEQAGVPLGSGAADEVHRARLRRADYAELAAAVTRVGAIQVKGERLAARYPIGLLRPVGDLDLVVADEPTLWACVRVVMAIRPVTHIDLSVVGTEPRHVLVELSWPPPDNLLDKDCAVEIGTAAFFGDGGAVPLRAPLPDEEVVASFLAVCEERFQRQFEVKDQLDMMVIGAGPPSDPECLVAALEYYQLAPEAEELLRLTSILLPLGWLGEVAVRLPPLAERELRRRENWRPADAPSGEDPVTVRLRQGTQPLYTMLLRRVERPDLDRVRVEPFAEGLLLRSPIGDHLLTDSAVVERSQYEAALKAVIQGALASQPHLPGWPTTRPHSSSGDHLVIGPCTAEEEVTNHGACGNSAPVGEA